MSQALSVLENLNCRLLYLVGQLRAGGLERQLYNLLQAMDRKRFCPEVAVWNYSETDINACRIKSLGVPIHSFSPQISSFRKLMAFRRLVTILAPEVVHSYTFFTNFPAYWGVLGRGAIAIGSVRSDLAWAISDSGPWIGRLCSRWPRLQIFNSFSAAEQVLRRPAFFAPERVTVIRNGIDLRHFSYSPPIPQWPPLIVGVGSLVAVKRWDRLLKAAQALKQQGHRFALRIAGNGPLLADLKALAQHLGLTDCVELLGHSDDIPDLIAKASFLVHTSESEGCPNVVMEAMASGRAVVATAVGDVPSLVEEGKTGFVVPNGDERTLLERMATLIMDVELCRQMGRNAREKAELEFGVDRLVRDTLQAYRSYGWKDGTSQCAEP
jgi:glycosyltransferase involved in cell wall biosynthesis